jgi:hypothetical protein
MHHKLGKVLTSLCIGLFAANASSAEGVNFAGKLATVVVSSEAGGNTDSVMRVLGPYLGKYLPGKPVVIYQNIPGASGIKAFNYFVQQVKPDGLTFFAGSGSGLDPTVMRNPAVQYDPRKLMMLGGFPAPTAPLLLRKDAAKQFYDKSLKPAIMGDVHADRNSDQMATWGPRYLGWNVRWVLGYRGTQELALAAMRGEIDMMVTYDGNFIDQMMKTGDFVLPAQTGDVERGMLTRSPRFPDVPYFSELVRPKLKTAEEIKAFKAWETLTQMGKWFALPQNTPAEMVDAYRRAFAQAIEDKDFRAAASKILGDGFTTASGKDMEQVAAASTAVSDDDLKFFDQLRQDVGIEPELPNK